jgi:hypothetical protein
MNHTPTNQEDNHISDHISNDGYLTKPYEIHGVICKYCGASHDVTEKEIYMYKVGYLYRYYIRCKNDCNNIIIKKLPIVVKERLKNNVNRFTFVHHCGCDSKCETIDKIKSYYMKPTRCCFQLLETNPRTILYITCNKCNKQSFLSNYMNSYPQNIQHYLNQLINVNMLENTS